MPSEPIMVVATISKVAIATVKPPTYSYRTAAGGGLDITFRVDTPALPREPQPAWELTRPAPTPPKKNKKESDDDFAERLAEYEEDLASRAEHQAEYDQELAEFQRAAEHHQHARLQFAMLTGLSALLAHQRVTLTIAPAEQDALPGFASAFAPGLPLLGAPADEPVTENNEEEME